MNLIPPVAQDSAPAVPKKKWKFLPGALAGSLMLHAIILLNVGAIVLISGKLSPSTFVMEAGESPVVSEEKVEEVQETAMPMESSPDETATPAVSGGATGPIAAEAGLNTMELISSTAASSNFTMPQGMSSLSAPIGPSTKLFSAGSNGVSGSGVAVPGGGNLFGSNHKALASLTGYLYDLKQSAKGEAPPPGTNFREVLTEVARNWNMRVLRDYYKARKPLYLSQLFVPALQADEAPKAFGVEKDVQPRQWMACYAGTVKAPESGNYRFVGFGDDYLIVRLKGQVVFDGSYHNIFPDKVLPERFGKAYSMPDKSIGAELLASPWIALEKDVEIPMEIVIAEDPGGYFSSILMIQKQGQEASPPSPFRLDKVEMPAYQPGYDAPQVGSDLMLFGVPPT